MLMWKSYHRKKSGQSEFQQSFHRHNYEVHLHRLKALSHPCKGSHKKGQRQNHGHHLYRGKLRTKAISHTILDSHKKHRSGPPRHCKRRSMCLSAIPCCGKWTDLVTYQPHF